MMDGRTGDGRVTDACAACAHASPSADGRTNAAPGSGEHRPDLGCETPRSNSRSPGPGEVAPSGHGHDETTPERSAVPGGARERTRCVKRTPPPMARAGEIWATFSQASGSCSHRLSPRVCPAVPCGQPVVGGAGSRWQLAPRPPAALCQAAPQGPGAGGLWLPSRCPGPGLGPSHGAQENVPCATDPSAKSEEPQPHQASQWRGPGMGAVVLGGGE